MSSFYSATIEFVSKQLYLRQINSSQCWYSSTAVSGKHHSHHSHQYPRSPDPNHLIIDSPHLPQLIKLPFIKSHSTVHKRSLSGLPFTTPNCTWLSDDTNLCVLTFQSPCYSSDSHALLPFILGHSALAHLQRKRLRLQQDVPNIIFIISTCLPLLSSTTISPVVQ